MSLRSSLFVTALLACAAVGLATVAQAQTPAAAPDAKLVAKGKRLFLQCQSCHEVADTTVVKIGPNLKGIYERPVASYPNFQYSKSLKALSFNWDQEHLDRWLTQPTSLAPETAMGFVGLANPTDRQALIAYLQTLK